MSTTRAGTLYKNNSSRMEDVENEARDNIDERGGVFEGGVREPMSEVMRMFVEDRRRREEEQERDRRRWLEEKRAWEITLEEERRRRDEEMVRREEHTHRQMELLHTLVQGVQLQGEAATKRADRDKDVRIPKLTEEDDIVAYLTTFERLMTAYEVKAERWAFKLATNLIGKAQQAYASLRVEDAGSYEKVKEAILQRYDITEESYRQRFRGVKRKPGESGRELVARLDDLSAKWLKSCKTLEEIRDRITLEQFLGTLQEEVRVFIKERKPKSAEQAGKLADDFVQARKAEEKGGEEKRRNEKTNSRQCHTWGKAGHLAKDCRMKVGPKSGEQGKSTRVNFKRDLREVECFNCHSKGHYSFNCPRNAMFCMERQHGDSVMVRKQAVAQPGVVRRGTVEGQKVNNILLDTGCSRTLVHQSLVPKEKMEDGEAVAIRCAHGDTVLYPLAKISLEVEGRPITVEAAVSSTLPMSVLLGTDNPELSTLLEESSEEPEQAFVVTTRAASRRMEEEEEKKAREVRECGVQPNSLEEVEHQGDDSTIWMREMDDDIFGESNGRKRKSKKEKRAEKRRREELELSEKVDVEREEDQNHNIERHELDISAEEMKELQATDPTLREARIAVKEQGRGNRAGYFSREGLLYRRWIPRGREQVGSEVEQLILPRRCQQTVMEVAHSVLLGGHLGRNKTTDRILQRFYWPTIYRDVAKFCRACEICQKTSGRGVMKAPLIPLPVISQPFERIAMDIVGPLPMSSRGNRFILVICDYATRYPEAVALRHNYRCC